MEGDLVNHIKRNIDVIGHFHSAGVPVEQIARLLLETNMSIGQIALKTGFSSPANISHYFKEDKGMNPLEYRKKCGWK